MVNVISLRSLKRLSEIELFVFNTPSDCEMINWGIRYAGLFMWGINRTKRYIQLPRNTKIDYGLYIGHGGPIVINKTTIIGNNCNLSQFTTIGANDGKAAVIGDNTYIGPNFVLWRM